MLDWISQHSKVLTVLTSIGTLIIWLVYAQLLYLGFRRQRRPRLIINRGRKKDIDALCIISNMSAESVFVEYIIAELETSAGTIMMDATEFDQEYSEGDEDKDKNEPERRTLSSGATRENTRQGPLASGDFLHIGTFEALIKRLAASAKLEMSGHRPTQDIEFHRLTIRLICVYGPEDMPVGAERSFDLSPQEDSYALVPCTWDTKRLASKRQRHRLRKMVAKLNSQNFTSSSTVRLEDDEPESTESVKEPG
ncbi:MAG: hypothetical protein UMU75_07670 [Halomonas sp.]|nr:hypothetical protein [Halomonas sp.]